MQQGGGHPVEGRCAAGRTFGLEQGEFDALPAGNVKHHLCAADKGGAEIRTVQIDDPSPAIEYIVAVSAQEHGRRARGWQAAELLGADGNVMVLLKQAQALFAALAQPVVTGAETEQAGADQTGDFGFGWHGNMALQWLKKKQGPLGRPRQRLGRQAPRGGFWLSLGLIALVFLLWVFFAPGGGYVHYRKAQRELSTIKEKNIELQKNNAALRQEIERLQTDEAYLEKVAREKHGLLKKDERVYEFDKSGAK